MAQIRNKEKISQTIKVKVASGSAPQMSEKKSKLNGLARRAPLIGQNGNAATARLFFRSVAQKKRCDKGSRGLGQNPKTKRAPKQKADGEGFEPPEPFQARLFSKQVH